MIKRLLVKLDDIPLRQFVSYAFILAVFVAIPFSVYLTQKQTNYHAGAEAEKFPVVAVDTDSIPYPNSPPVIFDVQKQYGKIDDSVLITGDNFGDAQRESFVLIGGEVLSGEEIPFWSNTQIEVKIPQGARDGSVEVNVNGQEVVWSGVLTIIR